MSKKKNVKAAARKGSGYPFETGDWAKWTNVKRLNWMRNFRDRMADEKANTYYKRFGLTDADMQNIIDDTAKMEAFVAKEQAARKMMADGFKADMNAGADAILKSFDPRDLLGKKGN